MSNLIARKGISLFVLLAVVLLASCKVCDLSCPNSKADLSCLTEEESKTVINTMTTVSYTVKRGDTAWKLIEEYTILPPEGWGMVFATPDLEIGEIVEFPIYYLKGGTVLEVHDFNASQKIGEGLALSILSDLTKYTPLSLKERKSVVGKVKAKIFRTEIFKNDHRRTPKDAFYKVKKGDTAWELVKRYTTLPSDKWEQIFTSSNLKAGQIMRFPVHYLKGGTVLEVWREPDIKWETVEENGKLSLKKWVLLDICFIVI